MKKKHCYIFDEDYIYNNIKLQEDHLETIIMLGDAADLTDKIESAKKELEKVNGEYELKKSLYEEYNDPTNVKSPKFYKDKLRKCLRGDENWAGRNKRIRGKNQNTPVSEEKYLEFVGLEPKKKKEELYNDFNDKFRELEEAKTGAKEIIIHVPSISQLYKDYNDETIQALLQKKIEKPELSEREKKLITLLQNGEADKLSERLSVFKDGNTIECPYCYQKVTPEHKKSLVESIEKILSKEVEHHQNALRKCIVDPINLDLSPYQQLKSYEKCNKLIKEINDFIQDNNFKLQSKISNLYEPINNDISNIKELIIQLDSSLHLLELERQKYNVEAKKTEPIVESLHQINAEITHYDVINDARQLEKQNKELEGIKKELDALNLECSTKRETILELESKRSNVRIALDNINACMKYIFFTDERLKIEYDGKAYKLLSHGKSVRPCDVSVGERNIIALCYFFTSILEGKEEKIAYDNEYLLVIDDPVSSFDTENRIGILSFLKYKLSEFLEGNQNTKALIMTHDLMTYYDLDKILGEINKSCAKLFNKPIFKRFELRDCKLDQFKYKNRQEYTEILKVIYRYASEEDNEHELVIGNIMRQALEAFSTFVYKKGIEEISTDEQILSLLPDEKYRTYYKNLMYRLVLHGGSHKEEYVKSMKDFRFFSLIFDDEKRRTAKDILCFIYMLNKQHLLEHLKDFNDVDTQLKKWKQEIEDRSVEI